MINKSFKFSYGATLPPHRVDSIYIFCQVYFERMNIVVLDKTLKLFDVKVESESWMQNGGETGKRRRKGRQRGGQTKKDKERLGKWSKEEERGEMRRKQKKRQKTERKRYNETEKSL